MNKVNKSEVVNYSASQMYDLVNDIRSYPEFLPMCEDIDMISEDETETEVLTNPRIKTRGSNVSGKFTRL